MAALADRFRTDVYGGLAAGAGVSVGDPSPEDELAGLSMSGTLAVHLGTIARELRLERERKARELLRRARAVNTIWLPPQPYTISGGVPGVGAGRASSADMAPQDGYVWFLTHLAVAGLLASDTVALYKVAAGTLNNYIHTFKAGPGTDDWSVSSSSVFVLPDDYLVLTGSGVTATQIVLSGQAVQVEQAVLADYLM